MFRTAGTALFASALVLASGCTIVEGNGRVVSETREIAAPFTRLSIGNGLVARMIDGPVGPVTLTGDENVLRWIQVRVDGDELVIEASEPGVVFATKTPIRVEISAPPAPSLRAIAVSGGSSFTATAVNSSGTIVLDVSGGSRVNLADLDAAELVLTLSGGSKANVSGRAPRLTATLSGGSNAELAALSVDTARVEGSGGSQIDALVTGTAAGTLSGGSHVTIKGGATQDFDLSGGSTVASE